MTDIYSKAPGRATKVVQHAIGLSFDGHTKTALPSNAISSESSYTNLRYLFGVQDPALVTVENSRNRRKTTNDSEHVKHRRTRSGCYTCRSRRIKCDEKHPTCERCKKGNRECVYPEKASAPKSRNRKAAPPASPDSPSSSSEEYENDEETERLKGVPDEVGGLDVNERPREISASGVVGADAPQSLSHRTSFTRRGSETPSLIQDKGSSPSPSTEGSVCYSAYSGTLPSTSRSQKPNTLGPDELRSDWSHLPQDLQFYLSFFYENITCNHYAMKHDSGDFLRSYFLDATLRHEALLYAVVGFSAFQYTLTNPRGRMQDFLQYYNKAVSLLLRSLRRGAGHDLGILLTMLQLATIEEYLGDWINLLGHQKAAYEILTELYTPQTVMESQFTRMVLGWYVRFDVYAGLMGGFETVLSREWFSTCQENFAHRYLEEPGNINWKIEEAIATTRLIAMDMSILFAKKGKGEIAHEQFLTENDTIAERISDWKEKMDPALQDPQWQVTDFTGAPPVDPNDIVNPYVRGTLYHGPLWSMNTAMIDWYSLDLMHKYQTAKILGSQPSNELGMGAYASCQLFEAIEYWPGSPKGGIIASQASLGIASLFLPRDKLHSMWCRRKLAVVESLGFIYPLTFRTKMSALFQDPSCMRWWLPNDESYPPIIRAIRKFVEERTSDARDVPTEDLRDMKAIFASLKLDDGKTHIPVARRKSLVPQGQVVVASDPDWRSVPGADENLVEMGGVDVNESGSYNALGYPEGNERWS